MKKLIILLVVVCSVASCAKDEIYSCNPEANLWAKSNVTEIQQMTRADFLAIGNVVYQKAAYNTFTLNQRQELWIGKIEEVLKLDWTEQERQHIKLMLNLIRSDSDIFSKEQEPEDFDKVEVELYRWIEYAQEELGWDKELLYAIIATPQVMNSQKKIMEINSNQTTTPRLKSSNESGKGDYIWCTCSTVSDWCVSTRTCKSGVGCKEIDGCGTLLRHNCNGDCK